MSPRPLHPLRAQHLEPQSATPRFLSTITMEWIMGRGLLLWIIGIPLPIILVLFLMGYLH